MARTSPSTRLVFEQICLGFDPEDKSDTLRIADLGKGRPPAPLPQVTAVKFQHFLLVSLFLLLLAALPANVLAQSSDPSLPTAVLSNEVAAKIPALDLGDPRMTRHYYAFEGTPGDLIISINSRNLNGDMDVFTAVSFRPLMKITIYANTIPPEVTKSIYLRTKQILILRVEARTPNDNAGNYRIRFSGAFAPFSGGIPVAETTEETSEEAASSRSGTRRVSSVGATIAEPPAETPAASAEPTPNTETAAEKPAEEGDTKKAAATKSTRTKPTRSSATARNPRRRPPARPKPKTDAEAEKTQTEEPKKSATEGEEKPATEGERPTQELSPPPGGRLIIERKDGTLIDRPMSTVRRVIVEGNQIVIVLKTGRTERIPMSNVAKMAIEPQ